MRVMRDRSTSVLEVAPAAVVMNGTLSQLRPGQAIAGGVAGRGAWVRRGVGDAKVSLQVRRRPDQKPQNPKTQKEKNKKQKNKKQRTEREKEREKKRKEKREKRERKERDRDGR